VDAADARSLKEESPSMSVSLVEDVRARLARVVGAERAQALLEDTMKKAGIEDITTSQDLFEVAGYLEAHGGSVAVIAAAIRMRALLRGADPDGEPVSRRA
jgi:hypothetical protein